MGASDVHVFAAGPKRLIYIDKASVAAKDPAIWVIRESDTKMWRAVRVEIGGPSETVYRPHSPLPPAGTYAWIETSAVVYAYG